ncbi:MAG: lipopolysaccharide biosynthesis protein [Deltaproteobacteria bacterium]|nr:lipopolysaccharide biosynthesis protein [Deltaproteobacteria bacterium]
MSTLKLAFWDLSGRIITNSSTLITSIILTRLLSPSEFGAFSIVLAVIVLSSVFIDFGFRPSIVQRKEITQKQLSTIFFLTLFSSILLFTSASLLGIFLEDFYGIDSLGKYLSVSSMSFILSALSIVPSSLLHRNLQFKRISLVNSISALISATVAILLAYADFRIWSLVFQNLTLNGISLIGFYASTKWLPSISLEISSVKELWNYGSKIFLAGLLETAHTRLDVFIIGRVFPLETLGYYNRAQHFDYFIKTFFASTITSVSFPLISKTEEEMAKTLYRRYLNYICLVSFCLVGITFITCYDIILIVFGERWLPSGEFFRIMSITGFVYPVSALMVTIISARGNSLAFLKLDVIKKCFLSLTYLAFFAKDIKIYLISLGVAYIIALIANIHFVKKEISISFKEQCLVLSKYFLTAFFSTLITFFLTSPLNVPVYHLLASSVVFVCFYVSIGYLLKLESLIEMKERLQKVYENIRYKNIFTEH